MKKPLVVALVVAFGAFIFGCGGGTSTPDQQTSLPTVQPGSTSNDVVEFNVLTEKPVAKKTVAPEYPEDARQNGIEGRVILSGIVETDGSVSSIQVLKSSNRSDMDDAAIAAFQQFEFEPGKVDGQPVRTRIVVPFQFKLNQ